MNHNFKTGDRVVAKCDCIEGYPEIKEGDLGTIVYVSVTGHCGVEWDNNMGGHDCHGRCQYGHGTFCFRVEDQLDHFEEKALVCNLDGLEELL